MRLFEIENPTHIEASPLFLEKLSTVLTTGRNFKYKLKEFLLSKLAGQSLGGEKILTGSVLRGFSRYQLQHGKRLIIYRRQGRVIRLYDLIEHNEYEGPSAISRLGSFYLSMNDFVPFDVDSLSDNDAATDQVGPPDETTVEKAKQALYEMIAGGGLAAIKNAIEYSDWAEVTEWVAMEVADLDQLSLFALFGGEQDLKDFIMLAVKQYGQYDEYQSI
jgi:hypothetical protein